MTSASLVGPWRAPPDGLQAFQAYRDLRAVVELLEMGFGEDLEERDRRWLADMAAAVEGGPITAWLSRLWPPTDGNFKGFVWYTQGRIVANASLLRGDSDVWLLANVVTHPHHRRRGIARRLVEAAIEVARAQGARQIQLQVRADNLPAQRLYQDLGFWQMGTANLLRLAAPAEARRLAVPAIGWEVVRVGAGNRDRARRLLERSGALERGGPAGPALQLVQQGGLLAGLEDRMRGVRRYAWAAVAGGEFRGLVAVLAMARRGPHRLDLAVEPRWQGRVEATLVDMALITLARHAAFEVDAEIDTRQASVFEALERGGFRGVRCLDRLALDLD